MDNPIKCEKCGKVIAKLVNGNFVETDPDWGMSRKEQELCGSCIKEENMEHPTKEEATKELCWRIWEDEELWDNLEDYIYNTAEKISDLEVENSLLYYAAITQDRLQEYLEKYWNIAEEAGWARIVMACSDCYDYISCEDEGMVADIFTFHHGEEEGNKVFNLVKGKVENIEKNGKFIKEISECINTFSVWPCQCCGSPLHGERHFMLFSTKKG